ncbi:MAG: ferredoxin [Candidatus Nanohalarchaeota archaeon]|nr:MAG: ferredoxin [Candidatus Nanohaloarchaeota archaeon]
MQIKINGRDIEVNSSETIFQAALRNRIEIPHLCYDPDLPPTGSCRLCICEVNGRIMSTCDTKVADNMVVETETKKVIRLRKINIELLLSRHKDEEKTVSQLQKLKKKYKIKNTRFNKKSCEVKSSKDKSVLKIADKDSGRKNNSNLSICLDNSKCILCGKCVNKCRLTQGVNALCFEGRGNEGLKITTAFDDMLKRSVCVDCGQCVLVCPSGALHEVDDISKVVAAIENPKKHVVVQTAPAIRASIGEEFGLPAGTLVTKKMVASLKEAGFDKVFDTNFGADLTIVEEATEFISRAAKGGPFPQFTSCCPAWIKYVEQFYPQFIPYLSSCKSPNRMLGCIAKTYYANKMGLHPNNIVVVSIMPCTAKKAECKRPDFHKHPDVDIVLTTREAARFLKQKGIDLTKMNDEEEFDNPLGEATGAGVIFGATGGVTEAALRTVYEFVTGNGVTNPEFNQIRGLPKIKEGSITMKGTVYNFAVAHGLSNAKILMEQLKEGKSKYHFIEIMACPGGCIGGGGQPIPTNDSIREKRIDALYREDRNMPFRKSHENPSIKKLYDEFLGKSGSAKAHKLLHTAFTKRKA